MCEMSEMSLSSGCRVPSCTSSILYSVLRTWTYSNVVYSRIGPILLCHPNLKLCRQHNSEMRSRVNRAAPRMDPWVISYVICHFVAVNKSKEIDILYNTPGQFHPFFGLLISVERSMGTNAALRSGLSTSWNLHHQLVIQNTEQSCFVAL